MYQIYQISNIYLLEKLNNNIKNMFHYIYNYDNTYKSRRS